MLNLRRLEIKRFRDVNATTLNFSNTFNILIGKNACGKSTLLQLLSDLMCYGQPMNSHGIYDIEFSLLLDDFRIEVHSYAKDVETKNSESSDKLLEAVLQQANIIESIMKFKIFFRHTMIGNYLFEKRKISEISGKCENTIEISPQIVRVSLISILDGIVSISDETGENETLIRLRRELRRLPAPIRFDESLDYYNRIVMAPVEEDSPIVANSPRLFARRFLSSKNNEIRNYFFNRNIPSEIFKIIEDKYTMRDFESKSIWIDHLDAENTRFFFGYYRMLWFNGIWNENGDD